MSRDESVESKSNDQWSESHMADDTDSGTTENVFDSHQSATFNTEIQQQMKAELVATIPRCIFPSAYLNERSPPLIEQLSATQQTLRWDYWNFGFSRAAIDWIMEFQDRLAWHFLHMTLLPIPSLARGVLADSLADSPVSSIQIHPIFPDVLQQKLTDSLLNTLSQTKPLPGAHDDDDGAEDVGRMYTATMAERWVREFERTAPDADGWKLAPEIHTTHEKRVLSSYIETFTTEMIQVAVRLTPMYLKDELITAATFQYIDDQQLSAIVTFLNMDDPESEIAGNNAPWPFPTETQLTSFPDHPAPARPLQYSPRMTIDGELKKLTSIYLKQWKEKDLAESWYHQPELVRKYSEQYAKLELPPGDGTLWRQYHIRPVQHYDGYISLVEFGEFYHSSNDDGVEAYSIRFDIVDVRGAEWPFLVQMKDTIQAYGTIRLLGPCDGASRWKGWNEEIVGHINLCSQAKILPLKRLPAFLCLTERKKLSQSYQPWGLWTSANSTLPPPPSGFIYSASIREDESCPYEMHVKWTDEVQLKHARERCDEKAIQFWRDSLTRRESQLKRAKRDESAWNDEERAAQWEIEQIIGVACQTLLQPDSLSTLHPSMFTDNHPMEVRVKFTESLLHRIFNESISDKSDSIEEVQLPWLPNVLIHLIAEYEPATLPFLQPNVAVSSIDLGF